MLLLSPTAFAAGAAGWTFAEYALHRYLGHSKANSKKSSGKGSLLSGDFGPEHLTHHIDPSYFAPTRRKLKAALLLVPALGAGASLIVGPRRGVSFALGFASCYAAYELAHRRIHTHAPRGPYSRWTRKHHLSHHFNAKFNHGVTTPLWDLAFGTYQSPGRVRVPRRIAPDWMVDPHTGALRADLAKDYELTGKPASTPRAHDAQTSPQTAETQTAETQTAETQTAETQTAETQTAETQTLET